MTAFIIQEDKCYRTRDGQKVGPMVMVADYRNKEWPFEATTFVPDDPGWGRTAWRADGTFDPVKDRPHRLDLVAEWAEPASPVCTRTVTEIVPGTYGILSVGAVGATGVRIPVAFDESGHRFYNAAELRAAAAVFTQLADALEGGAA